MERKIGEIFEYNGGWYQCVKGNICKDCAFHRSSCGSLNGKGSCIYDLREDTTNVIFKKLEKVGEPHFIEDEIFEGGKVYVQNFKVYKDFEGHKPICNDYIIYDWKNRIISIEIKQNKEDMEENYKVEDTPLTRLVGKYANNLIDYETFEKAVKELYSDKKDSKPTLKEFDLEAAKSGKPVCTRDGRKARIICFDRDWDMHIVALVTDPLGESVHYYLSNGKVDFDKQNDEDLMMLPEKRIGWINVNKDAGLFKSKEEAERDCTKDYATVRVEFEI